MADSTIRVNIIGDARKLQSELGKADKSLGSFGSTATKVLGAIGIAAAGSQLVDFAQDALGEFDRLGDATQRLELQLGDLAEPLRAGAEGMARLGLSAQDALELEAAFADTATAAGVADDKIALLADDAAATAGALSLIRDEDPATLLDLIAKAGTGSAKAMRALGIDVTDAEVATRALADTGKGNASQLTAQELAAARYELVLEDLKPALDAATTGTADLEQKQRELEARFETLEGKIGGALEGPLSDLLGWILEGITGWEMLADRVGKLGPILDAQLGPVGDMIDALSKLVGLLNPLTAAGNLAGIIQGAANAIAGTRPSSGTTRFGGSSSSSPSFSGRAGVTIVTSADPESVAAAVDTHTQRIGGR